MAAIKIPSGNRRAHRHQPITQLHHDKVRGVDVKHLRCATCHAWLSMGPSSDTRLVLQIEVRSAYLVANPDDASDVAVWGRDDFDRGKRLAPEPGDDCTDDWHAGWLARAIETHDPLVADDMVMAGREGAELARDPDDRVIRAGAPEVVGLTPRQVKSQQADVDRIEDELRGDAIADRLRADGMRGSPDEFDAAVDKILTGEAITNRQPASDSPSDHALFHQVAQLEDRLADHPGNDDGSIPTKNDHLSAASCCVISGDMESAKRVMDSCVEVPKSMDDLIARSSVGAGLADIAERGIYAHLVDLEQEMAMVSDGSHSDGEDDTITDPELAS